MRIALVRTQAHFVGRAGDDAADGGDPRHRQSRSRAPGGKQNVRLFLGQVGTEGVQTADFSDQARIRLGLASSFGCAKLGGQCRDTAAFCCKLGLSSLRRTAGDVKGVHGGPCAVSLPKTQDVASSLGIFAGHLPKTLQTDRLPDENHGPGDQHAALAWHSSVIEGVPRVSKLIQVVCAKWRPMLRIQRGSCGSCVLGCLIRRKQRSTDRTWAPIGNLTAIELRHCEHFLGRRCQQDLVGTA